MVRRKSIQAIRAEYATKFHVKVPIKSILSKQEKKINMVDSIDSYPPFEVHFDEQLLHAHACELDKIYSEIDGYEIARTHRSQLRANGEWASTESLQYGEVDSFSFAKLVAELVKMHTKSQENSLHFLDIGAGTGKAILSAAICGYFKTCIGFEIVPNLSDAANQAIIAATKNLKLQAGKVASCVNGTSKMISFCRSCLPSDEPASSDLNADDVKHIWQQSDVFFAPITCFELEVLHQVVRAMISSLKSGALVITTSTITRLDKLAQELLHREASPAVRVKGSRPFQFLEEKRIKYGKGTMTFFLFRKC